MSRRRYSQEYKREAVELTRLPGATLQQVAHDLGINADMLGRWRKTLEEHQENLFPGQGNARDEEIMKLKRELAQVKKERDFLREAAVHSIGDCNTRYSDEMKRGSCYGTIGSARPD